MPSKKRKAVDLTGSSSDSDSSNDRSISLVKTGKSKKGGKEPEKREHGALASEFGKSKELAPRSILFGGQGTGKEHSGRLEHVQPDSDGEGPPPPKRKRKSDTLERPNSVLPFAALNPETPQQRLSRLEYGQATLLFTQRANRAGRPKKKKQSTDASSSEEEGSDTDSGDERDPKKLPNKVCLATVIGADPDAHVRSAVVMTPQAVYPWLPNRFATTRLSKPRPDKPQAQAHESLDEDEGESTKKSSKKKSTKILLYASKIPLVLIHGNDGPACDKNGAFKEKCFPHNASPSFGSSAFILTRESKEEHRHLRLAISSANASPESWGDVENTVWIKDLPRLTKPATSALLNPTHTDFSSALLNFMHSDALQLENASPGCLASLRSFQETMREIDFTTTSDVRLVTSCAGKYEGDAVASAGGLNSLAAAISSLEPAHEGAGTWTVEYQTPQVGHLSRKFLLRLYGAIQGIAPSEMADGTSEPGQAAEAAFDPAKSVAVLFPSQDTVDTCKEKQAKYQIVWDGEPWDELPKSDLRPTALRQLKTKSGRLAGSNLMLILHRAPSKVDGAKTHEAFLYIGSHLPSPKSWGKFQVSDDTNAVVQLDRTDLGVLYRCAEATTWKELQSEVSELVPYKRKKGLCNFEDDTPATTPDPKPAQKPRGRPKGS